MTADAWFDEEGANVVEKRLWGPWQGTAFFQNGVIIAHFKLKIGWYNLKTGKSSTVEKCKLSI